MYIGIVDDDLRKKLPLFPNLELMKLSSWHKKNKDIVETFSNYLQYERYSKIYFGKNTIDNDFPELFLSKARKKISYVGKAFFGEKYISLGDDIESCLPDRSVYDSIVKTPGRFDFKTNLNKNLIRLQTTNNLIVENTNKSFLIYDKEAYKYELLDEIISMGKTQFVEEQTFTDMAAAVKLAENKNVFSNTIVLLDKKLTKEELQDIGQMNLKVPIYNLIIPHNFSSVDLKTGLGIVNSYLSEIKQMFKVTKGKGRLLNTFSGVPKEIIRLINGDISERIFLENTKKIHQYLNQYPNFIAEIRQIGGLRDGKL